MVYFTVGRRHWLAAILLIEASFDTHEAAATGWYEARRLELPRNLIVDGNGPLRFGLTCGFYTDANGDRIRPDISIGRTEELVVEAWDQLYRERQGRAPHVHVCRRLFVDLQSPPELSDEAAMRIFPKRRFPVTQTPAKVDEPIIDALVTELGIQLTSSRPPPLA